MMIVGCQQNPKTVTVDTEAEKAAIQKVFDEHFAALDSFDLDKLLSLQTEDVIEMPPNMPRIVGKEAYAEFCKPVLDFLRNLKRKEYQMYQPGL
jgi:ketosteroid isomerase-like protein